MKNFILKDKRWSIISSLSIIILWMILSSFINNEIIVPSIKSTLLSMISIIKGPDFYGTIKYTLLRTLLAFSTSLFLAGLMGLISSISKIAYNLMLPILKFLNSVPTIAIIVLALIWLNNELVPVLVGFIMVFPILYETILNSILHIDGDIIEMAKIYKVGKRGIIKNIYLPSILYNLSSLFHSALGINLKMVIAGEVLGQPKYGIGTSLQLQRMYLNTPGVFAWIVIILLISGIFDYMGKVINHSLGINRWK